MYAYRPFVLLVDRHGTSSLPPPFVSGSFQNRLFDLFLGQRDPDLSLQFPRPLPYPETTLDFFPVNDGLVHGSAPPVQVPTIKSNTVIIDGQLG